MVYRHYGGYGELPMIKLWTKTGEKDLPRTVKLEQHPVTNEVTAYVRCAIIERHPQPEWAWKNKAKPEYYENAYPICVAEKYSSLLTAEEFKTKEKEFKAKIAENIKKKYSAIYLGNRSIWNWD